MTTSVQARPIILSALEAEGESTDPRTVYAVQALARFDGGYGNFRSPPHGPEGPTSNNWGAVQHPDLMAHVIWRNCTNPDRSSAEVKALLNEVPPPSPNPTEWFFASDFLPGKGWFWGPYRAYPNPVDGARHVVRLMRDKGVLDVARKKGTWLDISRRLYDTHYYTGTSTNAEKEILAYARNLAASGAAIAEQLGEQEPIGWDSPVSNTTSGSDGATPSLRSRLKRKLVAGVALAAMGGAAWLWWRMNK
jgi:hypothetical protein